MPVKTTSDTRDGARRITTATEPAVAVLLAGGRGRRAGLDKRYLVLGGRTLLQRNARFLRALFPAVVVSHARGQRPDLGDEAALPLLPDAYSGRSPLAGIVTALNRLGGPLFVMAADLAFPDAGAVRRVLAAAVASGADITLPRVGPHHEPLFAVYGPGCLAPMRTLLRAGQHRIVEVFPMVSVREIPFPDAQPFLNINTMDEYREARRRLEEHEPAGDAPALVAIVGKSDSGKTTVVERLLPELRALGLRVGTVKHDAHGFEIDHPGKDSWRHGQAGAQAYAISSPERFAFVARLDEELPLTTLARRYFGGFDLLLAEGYKRSAPHRIEVFRAAAGHREPLCAPGEALALVTDTDLPHERRFALDDAAGLARFIAARLDTLRRY
jgi:molybdopterin-guanine dinucleotide biosynthesis protein B/molybdopterin-guanine dinucleotide biosynthesis protein